jgi:flagellar biosynthesis regulator FlaF
MSRNDVPVLSHEAAAGLRERLELSWKEENRAAQIAAAEAVAIGREVAQDSERQGEQLAHANDLADETKYSLDKAKRGIRNLTWTGWIANLVTKDVVPPEDKIKRYLSRSSSSQDVAGPLLKNDYKGRFRS